jgi:hypothetical protein
MNFKKVLINFIIGFGITLIVSGSVTYFYSLGFHETAKIDWATSFRLAITFGILFTVIEARKRKPKDK